jgi:Spy/CpxP family protein refolding chaperone
VNWQTKAVTAAVGAAAFALLRMAITKQASAADPPDIKSIVRDDDGEHDKQNDVRAVEEQATKSQQDITNRSSPWVY